jgi:hypothetical protein
MMMSGPQATRIEACAQAAAHITICPKRRTAGRSDTRNRVRRQLGRMDLVEERLLAKIHGAYP